MANWNKNLGKRETKILIYFFLNMNKYNKEIMPKVAIVAKDKVVEFYDTDDIICIKCHIYKSN